MGVLPEFFVSLCFFQCGAWMGFMIYLSPYHYETVLVGPQICGMVMAGLAGIILTLVKHMYGRIRFIHMLLIGLGTLSLLGSGLAFIIEYQDPTVGLFFGGMGHGMVFVTGLCYIHFRSKDDGFRVIRTGFCHLVHLGGLMIFVHTTSQYVYLQTSASRNVVVYRAGWIITAGSIGALGALVLNEILHCMGMYNYKKCRDTFLEDANDISDHFKSTLGFNDPDSVTQQPNNRRQFLLSVLALCLKITNITFNYHIFIYFTLATTQYLLTEPYESLFAHMYHYIKYYFGLLGLIIGLIASCFLSYKLIFMKSLGATFLAILIGVSLFTTEHTGMAGISFWLMYFSLGIGLFIPDVAIMEVSNIRLTELFLAKGYIVENTVLNIILFIFQRHTYMLFGERTLMAIGWNSGGPFVALFLLILILFIVFWPQTFRRGLITIQYIVLYDREDKPAVPVKPVTTEISMPS
ncbi:uncharacterized protein LOC129789043 [Lutzomyia longipalpis]|uniref:uncharacterized protein LOC129789043 n=1 Tax=Lutzomyia longipalpis TaxID=7200 RepID=UPI0024833873|nr:uncharacterized protein LOC129789043 [Lutzomyia longipalpis]